MPVRKNYITDCMISRRAGRSVLPARAAILLAPPRIAASAVMRSTPANRTPRMPVRAFRRSLSIPRPVPRTDVERSSLLLEKRTDHFDRPLPGSKYRTTRQIERRILDVVADNCFQPPFAERVDNTPNARPIHGSGAHRARLGRSVHGAAPEKDRIVALGCCRGQ